ITRKSQTRMKRIRNADLVIIDDLMFMAMNQHEANLFFHLINELYNNASIILTSNKAPKEWGELLGDPAITTAILDRIMHRVEINEFLDKSCLLQLFDNWNNADVMLPEGYSFVHSPFYFCIAYHETYPKMGIIVKFSAYAWHEYHRRYEDHFNKRIH